MAALSFMAGASATHALPRAIAITLAVPTTVAVVVRSFKDPEPWPPTAYILVLGLPSLGVLWIPWIDGTPYALVARILPVTGLALGLVAIRRMPNLRPLIGAAVSMAAIGSIILLVLMPGPVLDVWLFHTQAGDAISAGLNPYDSIRVENGAPGTPDDSFITGYPYPPVALAAYATPRLMGADPRIASAAAWVLFVALAATLGMRHADNRYLMVIPLAFLPAWPIILWGAFTEPLSLVLIAAAMLLWKRPVWSSLLLGLALASKQYFVVLAPLLLLARIPNRRTRLTVMAATVFAAVGIGAVFDPGTFFRATVGFHLTQPPRPDALNLYSLLSAAGLVSWSGWIAVVGGFISAVFFARRVEGRATMVGAMAAVLAVEFVLSPQAFGNYWFVVFALLALAHLLRVEGPAPEGVA